MSTPSNDKIENALNSISGMERATAKPFFFTRLEARMTSKMSLWEKVSSFLSRPAIAIAGICCVVMINALVILSDSITIESAPKTEIAGIMDEYSQLGTNNLFEFENVKP
ncbi:MAG: hypothetical protein ABI266_03490 [Ginsengibacter sp.]